jgi:hypothetical protein
LSDSNGDIDDLIHVDVASRAFANQSTGREEISESENIFASQ